VCTRGTTFLFSTCRPAETPPPTILFTAVPFAFGLSPGSSRVVMLGSDHGVQPCSTPVPIPLLPHQETELHLKIHPKSTWPQPVHLNRTLQTRRRQDSSQTFESGWLPPHDRLGKGIFLCRHTPGQQEVPAFYLWRSIVRILLHAQWTQHSSENFHQAPETSVRQASFARMEISSLPRRFFMSCPLSRGMLPECQCHGFSAGILGLFNQSFQNGLLS